jgi:hypothetical protein
VGEFRFRSAAMTGHNYRQRNDFQSEGIGSRPALRSLALTPRSPRGFG